MPRIWLELKEVHTFIVVYDYEIGLGFMEIRWLHLGDLEFEFTMFFFFGTQKMHGHLANFLSSREKISWSGIDLPTTTFGFGHLSTITL